MNDIECCRCHFNHGRKYPTATSQLPVPYSRHCELEMSAERSPDEAVNETLFPGNSSAYAELCSFMKSGEVIGFTGAGVSCPTFPTWGALLQSLLDETIQKGLITDPQTITEWRDQIDTDPLELADTLEKHIGSEVFRARFAKVFANQEQNCTRAHDALSRLALRGIVTLNYDDGHEIAFVKSCGRKPNSGRSQDHATLTRWVQSEVFNDANPPILHFHGEPSDPGGMVLTADDYDKFYQSSLPDVLIKQLWRASRLLVVGFGFKDPFLTRTAETVLRSLPSDNRHFALIGRKASDPVTPYQRIQFAKKFRLTPIFYEVKEPAQSSGAEDHSDLLILLQGLPTVDPSNLVTVRTDGETAVVAKKAAPAITFSEAADLSQSPRAEFERELFVSPHGRGQLYVEPKLTERVDISSELRTGSPVGEINLTTIINDSQSYVIASRPEYGATTLARRLTAEFADQGRVATLQRASNLPNYKKKLTDVFDGLGIRPNSKPILILDDFDFGQHERLLKELIGLNLFDRIIILATISLLAVGNALPVDQFQMKFRLLSLESLSPNDIRTLTTQFFDTSDTDAISATVHKLYEDLLALCIPVTPSNVIMYLTILNRDGDFTALNRVQIVSRYLLERLRRPSDAFASSFTARNKLDIVATFVFQLSEMARSDWSEADWYVFCRNYMAATLTQFDERALLNELLVARIFVRWGSTIAFKYRFFYVYFLGAYVAHRPKILGRFIESSAYLNYSGLSEVISELSADNEPLVADVVTKLELALQEFGAQYVPEEFDPFSRLSWPSDPNEEENFWKPLAQLVAQGPRNPDEIDQIKRSLVGERSTANQVVVVQKYENMERRLVRLHCALIDALKNSDSLAADLKKRAVLAALRGYLRLYQVGLLLAPALSKLPYFVWHGFVFINSMDFEGNENDERRELMTASAIHRAFVRKSAEEIGSKKLGEVFKIFARDDSIDGIINLMNFCCLLRAKPKEWAAAAAAAIADTDRKSLNLRTMLYIAFEQYYDQVNSGAERDEQKRLIATIRLKRELNKDRPGIRDVSRAVERLEARDYFRLAKPEIEVAAPVVEPPVLPEQAEVDVELKPASTQIPKDDGPIGRGD